eukprot:Skav219335  [mRNA]  locus=scaffold119:46692:61256:- [translate_table: standard]
MARGCTMTLPGSFARVPPLRSLHRRLTGRFGSFGTRVPPLGSMRLIVEVRRPLRPLAPRRRRGPAVGAVGHGHVPTAELGAFGALHPRLVLHQLHVLLKCPVPVVFVGIVGIVAAALAALPRKGVVVVVADVVAEGGDVAVVVRDHHGGPGVALHLLARPLRGPRMVVILGLPHNCTAWSQQPVPEGSQLGKAVHCKVQTVSRKLPSFHLVFRFDHRITRVTNPLFDHTQVLVVDLAVVVLR